jgi:hypothetical protein
MDSRNPGIPPQVTLVERAPQSHPLHGLDSSADDEQGAAASRAHAWAAQTGYPHRLRGPSGSTGSPREQLLLASWEAPQRRRRHKTWPFVCHVL